MAFGKGALAYFSLNAQDISTYIDDVGLNEQFDKLETTTLSKTAKTYIPGLADSTVKLSGKWDATADGYLRAGLGVVVAWIYGPAGSTGGFVKRSGSGFLTNLEVKTPVGGAQTWSADLTVTNGVTNGTF